MPSGFPPDAEALEDLSNRQLQVMTPPGKLPPAQLCMRGETFGMQCNAAAASSSHPVCCCYRLQIGKEITCCEDYSYYDFSDHGCPDAEEKSDEYETDSQPDAGDDGMPPGQTVLIEEIVN